MLRHIVSDTRYFRQFRLFFRSEFGKHFRPSTLVSGSRFILLPYFPAFNVLQVVRSKMEGNPRAHRQPRHCEERSDVAIQTAVQFRKWQKERKGCLDCHGPTALAMTRWGELPHRAARAMTKFLRVFSCTPLQQGILPASFLCQKFMEFVS
jgi:hypothetical protein